MKIFTTFCCAALALCSAIYAQGPIDHMMVHFNSPVLVGETKLPAGDCDIRFLHGNSNTTILVLRAQDGSTAAVVASRLSVGDQESDENASVVLNHRGNDLQVYRVMLPDHTGYQLNSAE